MGLTADHEELVLDIIERERRLIAECLLEFTDDGGNLLPTPFSVLRAMHADQACVEVKLYACTTGSVR